MALTKAQLQEMLNTAEDLSAAYDTLNDAFFNWEDGDTLTDEKDAYYTEMKTAVTDLIEIADIFRALNKKANW